MYPLNVVPYGCRQLPATLLPYADNVAAICQQHCWRLPTIKKIYFFMPIDTGSVANTHACNGL